MNRGNGALVDHVGLQSAVMTSSLLGLSSTKRIGFRMRISNGLLCGYLALSSQHRHASVPLFNRRYFEAPKLQTV